MQSLSGLSDQTLLARIQALIQKERTTTLAVVLHLNEIECRKLISSSATARFLTTARGI